MLQKLLPVIIIVVAGALGGGGGFFAKSMMSKGGDKEASHEESEDGHGKDKKNKGNHPKQDQEWTHHLQVIRKGLQQRRSWMLTKVMHKRNCKKKEVRS